MTSAADNALIVQSDSSVLLDVHAPRAGAARAALAPFAELVKSQVKKFRQSGSPEVAFRVAVKGGKVNFTARAMKGATDE